MRTDASDHPGVALAREERNGAAWWRLDRRAAMNALDAEVLDELGSAVADAAATLPVAVAVTGAGSAFCAGADLGWARQYVGGGMDRGGRDAFGAAAELMSAIESLPVPVIAAVNGVCVAGGLELALACDLIVAATSARLGDGHARFGLVPGGGSTARLTSRVGPAVAKRLLFTAEILDADVALALGLVDWVVPGDQLEQFVDNLVETFALRPPEALAKMKALVATRLNHGHAAGVRAEFDTFVEHMALSTEPAEGLAAFSERRDPIFRTAP
jgi:enoyl-CoA hydratase